MLRAVSHTMNQEPGAKLEEPNTREFLSSEAEAPRGRKRRRSPLPFIVTVTASNPSGESATLRGRSRHRSTSLVTLSTFSSRAPSRSLHEASYSPSKKRYLQYVQAQRRRSQSPSRSQSPNTKVPPKRRRQRTRSRSRPHKTAPGAEIKSPLRNRMVIEKQGAQDGPKAQG